MKILVAEDDGPSRYLLGAILRPSGYEVASASNGQEALDILHHESIDLIISDLMMPKMDGFQLLRHCKTDDTLKSIPFIVYTATYTEERDLKLARDLGADCVLIKPVEPEEMLQIVTAFMSDVPDTTIAEPTIHMDEKEQFLQKYSNTVVAKLDKKVSELRNTNRLLRAIRKINQMMIREKDPSHLLTEACRILTEEAGYQGAWIVQLNNKGRVDLAKEAGLDTIISDIISCINKRPASACIQQIFDKKGEVVVIEPEQYPQAFPIDQQYSEMQSILTGMKVNEQTIGMLGVFLQPGQEANPDETLLFSEIADDIAYAMNALAVEEEKKVVEKAKKESEKKYRELFNHASDSIFLHDLTENGLPSRFLEVNDMACDRLGYSREELLTMNVSDINTLTDTNKAREIVRELLDTGNVTFEGFHVCKDRSVFPVEVASHKFTMTGQQVVLSICRDITERKEMEKQIANAIRQIEENMGQLAILNDEIRNPLTVISAYASITSEKSQEIILRKIQEIDDIVTQLDQGWLRSEKVWAFLKRYYGISYERGNKGQ